MIDFTINQYFHIALLGGILATSGMTAILYIFDKAGLVNGDMVRAVGSLITKKYENALVPGLLLHYSSGIFFSIVYALAIDLFNTVTVESSIAYGVAIGIFHGAVVALVLVVIIAEHHPLEKFQKAGVAVAVLHWAAHIVFGLIVGIIVGITVV